MILSFYYIMYGEVVQRITKKQYHSLSEHIQTLNNMQEIADMLVDKSCPIWNIPYMDEIIDLSDNYEVDREKVLTIKQRIFRRF